MLIIILLCISLSTVNCMKDGYFARKLDEYHSTFKCVANIAEELMPEFNTFLTCCGTWFMKDWFSSIVLDKCYEKNYHQINNLSEPFVAHMNKLCPDYPAGSKTCKLLPIVPIIIVVLFVLIIVFIISCGIYSCVKLRKLNKKYRYEQNIKDYYSKNDEVSSETKKIEL